MIKCLGRQGGIFCEHQFLTASIQYHTNNVSVANSAAFTCMYLTCMNYKIFCCYQAAPTSAEEFSPQPGIVHKLH